MHSLSIASPEDLQYLVINFWNTQSVDLYELKGLLESSTGDINDNMLAKVNVEEFAPFSALDVDQVHVFTLVGLSYLIVTLSNGYVLCFNLYPNAAKATQAQIVRLS